MINQPFTNEAGLLACLIHKPELYAQISSYLMPHHFQDGRYRKAYEEFVAISQVTKSPPDSTTWEYRLIAIGVSTTDNFLLATIYQQIPIELIIPSSIEVYAKALVDEFTRIEHVRLANKTLAKMVPGADIQNIRKELELEFADIEHSATSLSGLTHVSSAYELMQERHKLYKSGKIATLKTGIAELDELIKRIRSTWLIIVAARPGMGKTAFMICVALYLALNGVPISFFTMEMTKDEIVERMLAVLSQILLDKIVDDNFDEGDTVIYDYAVKLLLSLPIHMEGGSNFKMSHIRSEVARHKLTYNTQAVFIDQFHVLGYDIEGTELEKLNDNSSRCKALATDYNVAVFLASQLNRELLRSQDKMPELGHLKGTGNLEQDAEMVLMLHNYEYYEKGECTRPGITKVLVEKHRHGKTGDVDIGWKGETVTFFNLNQPSSYKQNGYHYQKRIDL